MTDQPASSEEIATLVYSTAIEKVIDEHQFESTSKTSRGGIVTRRAGCACDPAIEFEWATREAAHRDHLHLHLFVAGRMSALRN